MPKALPSISLNLDLKQNKVKQEDKGVSMDDITLITMFVFGGGFLSGYWFGKALSKRENK